MAVETISAPEYEEIPIVNLDFGFAFGGTAVWTLYPGDRLDENDVEILLTFIDGMEARVLKRNIAFWTRKKTTLKRKVAKPVRQSHTSDGGLAP